MSVADLKNILKHKRLTFLSPLPSTLSCVLCRNVLVDAYHGCCGCRFCCECIKAYLGNESRKCPSGGEECENAMLQFKVNVHEDPVANRDVSNLTVLCFNSSCSYTDSVRKMKDHILTCNEPSMDCAFQEIGCSGLTEHSGSLTEHLQTDAVAHSELLISFLKRIESDTANRIQMEIAAERNLMTTKLQEISAQMLQQMNELKCTQGNLIKELDMLKENEEMTNGKADAYDKQNEFHQQWRHEKDAVQEIRQLVNDLKTTQDVFQEDVRKSLSKREHEITEMKNEIHSMRVKHTNNDPVPVEQINFHVQHEKVEIPKKDNLKQTEQLPAKTTEIKNAALQQRNGDVFEEQENETSDNDIVDTDENFYWKINGVGLLRQNGEFLYSDTYSTFDGYAFRFRLRINKWPSTLCVSFQLQCGSKDNTLKWPMSRAITANIIDQQSGLPLISKMCDYSTADQGSSKAYMKPQRESNNWIDAINQPISIPVLKKYTTNDSLLVCFTVAF